jgi:hypothetical protein
VERELIDETAAHLLLAAMLCIIDATMLVAATSVTPAGQKVSIEWTAAILAVSVYIVFIFLICIPRLYSAYVQINGVSDHLNCYVKGKAPRRRR